MSIKVASSLSAANGAKASFVPDRRRTIKPAVQACAECRRLKLKCSRIWPCSTCIRRGCGSVCPEGQLSGGWKQARENLIGRVSQLEATLTAHGIPLPPLEGPPITGDFPLAEGAPASSEAPENLEIQSVSHSFGSLALGEGGKARYCGPGAGVAWVQSGRAGEQDGGMEDENELMPAELFARLASELPPRDETARLVDIYYNHLAWMYRVIPRDVLESHIRSLYFDGLDGARPAHPHHLAVVFFVLAVGTIFNLDIGEKEASNRAQRWYTLGRTCLANSQFVTQSTIAVLQALHILGTYLHNSWQSNGTDQFWPIMGLGMRIIQSMGLHRDGSEWGLSGSELEERRRVFWEWFSIDSFQALCYGRPYAISARQIDCKIPSDDGDDMARPFAPLGEPSFLTLRYRLCTIFNRINDAVCCVEPPDYNTILALDKEINDFQRAIPSSLSCPVTDYGDENGPTMVQPTLHSDFNVHQSQREAYEQHTLACNINEAILFLHRGYFARALNDDSGLLTTLYAPSMKAIAISCKNLVSILKAMFTLNPIATMRQYFFWFHVLGAAVCLAATVIRAPGSELAPAAWKSLTTACEVFGALPEDARARRSLPMLARLYHRAQACLYAHAGAAKQADDLDNEVLESFLGLSTRLIADTRWTSRKSQSPPGLAESNAPSPPLRAATSLTGSNSWPSPPLPAARHRSFSASTAPHHMPDPVDLADPSFYSGLLRPVTSSDISLLFDQTTVQPLGAPPTPPVDASSGFASNGGQTPCSGFSFQDMGDTASWLTTGSSAEWDVLMDSLGLQR